MCAHGTIDKYALHKKNIHVTSKKDQQNNITNDTRLNKEHKVPMDIYMYKVPNDECKIMTRGDGGKPFGKGELVRLFRGHRALSNVIERQ